MIRHLWSVICASSAIDKDENKLSLFDVTEQITLLEPITEPGVIPFQLHFVSLWRRADLAHEAKSMARIRLLAPSGEQVGKTQEYTIDLTKFLRLRQRVIFRALPVRSEGTYEFVVEFLGANDEWELATRIPLEVVVKLSPDSKPELPSG